VNRDVGQTRRMRPDPVRLRQEAQLQEKRLDTLQT